MCWEIERRFKVGWGFPWLDQVRAQGQRAKQVQQVRRHWRGEIQTAIERTRETPAWPPLAMESGDLWRERRSRCGTPALKRESPRAWRPPSGPVVVLQ